MNPQLSQSVHGVALGIVVGSGAGVGGGPISRKTGDLSAESARKINIYLCICVSVYVCIICLHLHWP